MNLEDTIFVFGGFAVWSLIIYGIYRYKKSLDDPDALPGNWRLSRTDTELEMVCASSPLAVTTGFILLVCLPMALIYGLNGALIPGALIPLALAMGVSYWCYKKQKTPRSLRFNATSLEISYFNKSRQVFSREQIELAVRNVDVSISVGTRTDTFLCAISGDTSIQLLGGNEFAESNFAPIVQELKSRFGYRIGSGRLAT